MAAYFLAYLFQLSLAFGAAESAPAAAVATPTPKPLSFSDRLSKSFDTSPIGKTHKHLGSLDSTEEDTNVQDQKPLPTPYGHNSMDWDPLSE